MEEPENNEIKILIDALKYTSNIIIDLTNKLTNQEEKINALENKLNKIQKITMENNYKLKTINLNKFDKHDKHDKHDKPDNILLDTKKNLLNNTEEIHEYIIDKNKHKQNQSLIQTNKLDHVVEDKKKIDKLIGSIIKQKNDLNKLIDENNKNSKFDFTNKSCIEENNINSKLDFTIKTATNKSGIDESKSIYEKSIIETNSKHNNENEQEKIINAQNNDLNNANNILRNIRRKANMRKM